MFFSSTTPPNTYPDLVEGPPISMLCFCFCRDTSHLSAVCLAGRARFWAIRESPLRGFSLYPPSYQAGSIIFISNYHPRPFSHTRTSGYLTYSIERIVPLDDNKSLHSGLYASINSTFHFLYHFFIAFSRQIASYGFSNSS